MKAFNKIFAAVIAMIILIFAVFNLLFASSDNTDSGRPYRVEINRLVFEIEQSGFDSVDMSGCEYVTHIEKYSDKFYDSDSDYTIREINGVLYRFDYTTDMESDKSSVMLMVNIILGILSAMIIGVLIFIRIKILLPFENLTNVPYELSKGNLTCPIKEDKSRFFGRFIWGVDLLRENMEQQKQRELDLQRDKKMLLLSLSHDIKTPLSAIKLYSKALSKGLYDGREKQIEIAESINTKADEIESYVLQIITASREDFLSLEVEMGEFYLSELISKIKLYYTEKLRLIRTDFFVGSYMDRLLKGDLDRSVEVLQNVMENAIKYGDGKSIDIQISEEDGCLLITVRNSGCTLSENELPHIFESFWRGENAENEKGSGLGLYINRQLMHKMNGEIFAEIKDGFISVSMVFSKA
ncbi:HAMP domain-containing histidine kinase [Porcipelethomonas ammoniilytica]|uniref:sensor histidine kinase n=1 Tax=Porcipelethomonas ammoniilytica TaxID=2981722 RepID=UPI0008219441|nr:HAMP domain-containing sensor histidine kinase [Porcipelethomonas ammoniilytica]MCU6719038.1 HAMP domain-containing histidine kinase [Porcipelethomonas ammoniilytica]SCI67767.1 Osmolarity sensor protein EnvZ [uncultured Ruminococcus sp.]